jgi:hypothetical protein
MIQDLKTNKIIQEEGKELIHSEIVKMDFKDIFDIYGDK